MPDDKWARLLAYVTGWVNQKLLLQNEYLAARIKFSELTFPLVYAESPDSLDHHGKKTAEAILQEVAREVDQWLRVIFNSRRKTGRLDLEASEMLVRSAMHQAGAAA